MSITVSISTNPATYSPVNKTDVWFVFNSASYSLADFKYVAQVYELDGNSNVSDYLGQYKFPPRPVNGDGVYSPAKLLKSVVSYTLSPTASLITPDLNHSKQYSLNYGYQYSPNLSFVDTFVSGTSVGLTFSTQHNFLTGDIVNINKTNKNINSYYDGQSTIISVGSSFSFVIDKVVGITSSVETGIITDVISVRDQSSDFWAYNGKRQYEEINIDFGDTYVSSGLTSSDPKLFLENYSGYKPIFLGQYETSTIMTERIWDYEWNIASYDSNLTLISDADFNTYFATQSGALSFTIPTGTKNHEDMGFSFSSNFKYYNITGRVGPNTIYTLWREIVDNCSIYNNYRVAYLNSLGSFEYINFNYDSKKSYNIERTEYTKTLPYNYVLGDRGRTILGTKIEQNYILNSDWLTEYQYQYYLDILKSDEVYIVDTIGNKYPIIVNDSTYEFKTYKRDKLFALVLNVTSAYEIK